MHRESEIIKEYRIAKYTFCEKVNIKQIGEYVFPNVERIDKPIFQVKVVENIAFYMDLMKK